MERAWVQKLAINYLNKKNIIYNKDGEVDLTEDPQWVRRSLARFDSMDVNRKGQLKMCDLLVWVDELNTLKTISRENKQKLTQRLKEMFEDIGFTNKPMTRQNFPHHFSKFAAKERLRKRRQQETYHGKCTDLMFEIIGINNDGKISLKELQIRMQSIQLPKTVADSYFKFADQNNNGFIDIKEFKRMEFRFWFKPIDKSLNSLYGGYFSGNKIDLTKDPQWLRRVLRFFDYNDVRNCGTLYLIDILSWADNLEEICDNDEIENIKEKLTEVFSGGVGVTSKGVKRRDFPKLLSTFAQEERGRKERNEETLYQELLNCILNKLVDTNDYSIVAAKEIALRNKALGLPEETANHLIKMANPNENGDVEIEKLFDLEFSFWYEPIDEGLNNLYGGFFSGIDLSDDPKWLQRIQSYFDTLDTDNDGIVKLGDLVDLCECLREQCNATNFKMKSLKKCYQEYYRSMGITEFGISKTNFATAFNRFSELERERKCIGENTVHEKTMEALFDVIGVKNDSRITLKEMKIRMKAIGLPEEAATYYLEITNKKSNNVLETSELIDIEFRFWFQPIDTKIDNLYGGFYSGNEIDLNDNPKWVRRSLSYFDSLDMEKNGVVTLDQIANMVDFMKEPCKATNKQMAKLKECMKGVYGDVGFTSEGMERELFPLKLSKFAKRERLRKQNKQETLHSKLIHALFDVIDINNDGHITLKEMQIRMVALGMPKTAAKCYLKLADANANGTVELNELIDIEFRFWFQPIDEKLDKLYGGKYSGNIQDFK